MSSVTVTFLRLHKTSLVKVNSFGKSLIKSVKVNQAEAAYLSSPSQICVKIALSMAEKI